MKRSDFEVRVDERGFSIFYKGNNIGGVRYAMSDPIPLKDRSVTKLGEWWREGNRELEDILVGNGLQEYIEAIEKVDKMSGGDHGQSNNYSRV